MCDECAYLQAENARLHEECNSLRAKNEQLRAQVKRAKLVIKAQKKQLDAVRDTAWKIMKQAEKAMAGHLPRGTWSLWKGRGETASIIFYLVIVDWATFVGDVEI